MAYTSQFIEISNNQGLSLILSTLGAGVRSVRLNGQMLALEMKTDQRYMDSPQFFGKTLGRVSGRIPYDKEIAGHKLDLPQNEKGICLHGGVFLGLTYKDFTYSRSEDENTYYVDFCYLSPDGETGFNGNVTIHVIYELKKNENAFSIHFKAVSDQDTILSLSNHIYWNLDGKDINDYHLTVRSSETGKYGSDSLLVLGKEPVRPEVDFRNGPRLKDKLDQIDKVNSVHNLDHIFFFDQVSCDKPKVTLESEHVKVECYTSYECVNIYCDNTKSDTDFRNGEDFNGMDRRGIAIEPQKISLGDHALLKKDELYDEFITYKISGR